MARTQRIFSPQSPNSLLKERKREREWVRNNVVVDADSIKKQTVINNRLLKTACKSG